MPLCNDTIKNREIRFKLSTPDQAEKAAQLLSGVPDIEHIEIVAPCCMRIRYCVEKLTLKIIESALREAGFDLDDSLVIRLKRAVFSYCEDALRDSLVDKANSSRTPTLTLPHHALQDPRPHDWHKHV